MPTLISYKHGIELFFRGRGDEAFIKPHTLIPFKLNSMAEGVGTNSSISNKKDQ
jgi:hypothetical protein